MYKPLPKCLTIKESGIHGLGIFTTEFIDIEVDLGIAHINLPGFPQGFCRTPLGGFYNHSDNPNVQRMVTNILPKLKFGDQAPCTDSLSEVKNIEASRERLYPNVIARFMYLISIKNIKNGEELTANYNLYTYPKTGIGFQTF